VGALNDILRQAREAIDEPLPSLDFKIEWKPWCKRCGKPCGLVMMPRAVLPASDCCQWFYRLDCDVQRA